LHDNAPEIAELRTSSKVNNSVTCPLNWKY